MFDDVTVRGRYGEDTCQQRFFNIDLYWQSWIFSLTPSTINPVWLITELSNLRFTILRIQQSISSASLTPDFQSISPRIQTILRLDSNFAVSKRVVFCCEIAKAVLLDGLLTHLLVLLRLLPYKTGATCRFCIRNQEYFSEPNGRQH